MCSNIGQDPNMQMRTFRKGFVESCEIKVKETGKKLRRWRVNYGEGREMEGGVIRQVLLNLASFARLFPTRATPLCSQTKESIF